MPLLSDMVVKFFNATIFSLGREAVSCAGYWPVDPKAGRLPCSEVAVAGAGCCVWARAVTREQKPRNNLQYAN